MLQIINTHLMKSLLQCYKMQMYNVGCEIQWQSASLKLYTVLAPSCFCDKCTQNACT